MVFLYWFLLLGKRGFLFFCFRMVIFLSLLVSLFICFVDILSVFFLVVFFFLFFFLNFGCLWVGGFIHSDGLRSFLVLLSLLVFLMSFSSW